MRSFLPVLGAFFAVALVAPNAFADSADDGEDTETVNVSGAWVPTSRESDDWATTTPAPPAAVAKPATVVVKPEAAPAPRSPASDPVARESAPRLSDSPAAAENPHEGALGFVRLGALAGVGAPSIFSGQVLAKIGDWVGIAGEYGATPSLSLPVGNGGATMKESSVSASARIYPFRGAFFFGGAVGSQSVDARVTQSAAGQTGAASFQTRTLYVEPEIGLLYRFSFGLAVGCDAGLRIPVSGSGSESMPLPGALQTAMNYTEKDVVPSINLLRLGYVL